MTREILGSGSEFPRIAAARERAEIAAKYDPVIQFVREAARSVRGLTEAYAAVYGGYLVFYPVMNSQEDEDWAELSDLEWDITNKQFPEVLSIDFVEVDLAGGREKLEAALPDEGSILIYSRSDQNYG